MEDSKVLQQYTVPTTVEEANGWLEYAGIKHIKFGNHHGKVVVRLTTTNKIIATGDSVKEMCMAMVFNKDELRKIHLNCSEH